MKAKLAIFLALALIMTSGVGRAASVVWLEAEQFDRLGGWTRDAQFVDQMGSPYLLAIGLKGPVGDAATRTAVPAAGKYRLWIRSRDWVPEQSPGRFQVVLGGKTVEHVFGQGKAKGWTWEDGGVHQLAAGNVEVRLHDLTGHYGRCDVVVLTDDPAFHPPTDLKELAAAREQHGGVSRQVKRLQPYDTVVVGGGLAGTMAAVASARMGCRTALVQNRPVLGGNASSEILVRPGGDRTREPFDPEETGIIEEFRGDEQGYSERMLKLVQEEPNLDLYLNTHATGVEMSAEDTIAAVKALQVNTGARLLLPASIFIDCTGDGVIGVWAGAEYRHGREPRSMYNETRAPERADGHTMGGTLRYASELRSGPVRFEAPAWARKFPACSDFNVSRHPRIRFGGWQWIIEYGGMLNTYDDAEEIRDELLRIIWGMWDHVKNHCPQLKKEAENYELTWVSYVVGKRESRRLIGDYVMTEHDIDPDKRFDDGVAYGGWGIDLHPPGGFYDKRPPATFSHETKFSIPFRSLYTKDVGNLMMAGRTISVSHAALGTTRLMITCGVEGQAVGTAAGFCKRHQTTPRDIYQNHIGALQQQLLKDGCYIIDLPNRDPGDLALMAKVTASSVAPPGSLDEYRRLTVHPMGCDRAVMFQVKGNRLNSVTLHLRSENPAPTPLKLGLRAAKELGDFSATDDLATATAAVPPKSNDWVQFELNTAIKPGYYYAWLPKTPGLAWSLFDMRPPNTTRAYRTQESWNRMSECYKFKLDPPTAPAKPADRSSRPMFASENVTNGFARAIRGWPNAWMPDPAQPLPQWVELDFGKPLTLNCVHVSFQTKALRADDFRIDVIDGDGWRGAATITGNANRRRVIRFDRTTTSKLRLVLTKIQPGAAVCEIRAYDEPTDR